MWCGSMVHYDTHLSVFPLSCPTTYHDNRWFWRTACITGRQADVSLVTVSCDEHTSPMWMLLLAFAHNGVKAITMFADLVVRPSMRSMALVSGS